MGTDESIGFEDFLNGMMIAAVNILVSTMAQSHSDLSMMYLIVNPVAWGRGTVLVFHAVY